MQLFGNNFYNFTTSDANTTSLTPVDVPLMKFPISAADSVVVFEFVLIIGSSSATGLKVSLTGPVGVAFRAWAVGSGSAQSTLVVDLMNQSGVLGVAFNTFIGQNNYLSIRGGVVNGNFSGDIKLQAAKVTSGTATLSAGSYFVANIL